MVSVLTLSSRYISKGLKRPTHLQKASTLPVIPRTPAKLRKTGSLQADPTPALLRTYTTTTATTSRPTSLTPCTPQTTRTLAPKTPRTSKKALAQATQAHRAAYAQKLFDELNREVFDDGLPADTTLIWSNRLLSTAGRARWHRAKDRTETSEIELAIKVLDSDERIRNTLSHEMCHLACWTINKDPKEGHGPAWKTWASKVMKKRPEIRISTRHEYEISYPFQWECNNCCKIYGRFSKSIRADEVLCGACKTGKLEALFTTRVRAKKTPGTSL
ncbi:SprT-like family-domain-containing protein [Amylostereum chailletii]|nr:SprT-like family-domain-containing protein [Amylostereum chailletii]